MAKFNLTGTVTKLNLTGTETKDVLTGTQGVTLGVLSGAGPQGPQGEQGVQGVQGPAGPTTVDVGATTTLSAGSSATVTNTGDTTDAVFAFGIPQGSAGVGVTNTSYNASNGVVTFTYSDSTTFDTGDLRGADGTGTGTVTQVSTGSGLTGGPITSSGTISHDDTSSQANVSASTNTFVDGLTFDDFGHVTGVSTSAAFDGEYGSLAHTPLTFAPSAHTLSSHSDVSTTAASGGQVLTWDDTGSGEWVPQDASSGGASDTSGLSDYADGTWTPSLDGATVTYTTQQGTYVKIGKLVHVQGRITVNTISNQTNTTIPITGLPYTPDTSPNSSGSVSNSNNFTGTNVSDPVVCGTVSGGIRLYYLDSTNELVTIKTSNFQANTTVTFAVSYYTSS